MENERLNVAAKLGAVETVTLIDGYDKRKNPRQVMFRYFTIDDVKALSKGYGEFYFVGNDGKTFRRCRQSSALKTWKRDPNRFECSFKYGMYESVRWSQDEMMRRLLVEVE